MKWAQDIIRFARWLVGLAILGYLVYSVNPAAIVTALTNVRLVLVPLWFALYLVCLALGALNIHFLLRPFSTVSYGTLLRYDLVATSLGYFTPAQIGAPVALALNLKKEDGVLYSRSVSALLLDKLSTFLITSILAVIGILRALSLKDTEMSFGQRFAERSSFVAALVGILIVGGFVVLYLRSKRIRKITIDVLEALASYRSQKKYLLLNLLVTGIVQCTLALLWVVTFSMIGVGVDFMTMITTAPAISLVGYIPVTVGGIGTQELSAVYLWKTAGIAAPVGLSSFLLARALTVLISLVLLLLKMWKRPLPATQAPLGDIGNAKSGNEG